MATITGDDNDNVLAGTADADVLIGGGGSDTLAGNDGDDTLFGLQDNSGLDPAGIDGADVLDGGAGNDLLRGNAGDDTLLGRAGDDNLRGDAGNDVLDGGEGVDVVSYRFDELTLTTGVFFSAASVGGGGTQMLADGLGGVDRLVDIERVVLTGSSFDDTLIGGSGSDQITGGAGNDQLVGNGGEDLFIGDAGDDRLEGGDDWDIVAYISATSGVTVDLRRTDSQAVGGDMGSDLLLSIENVEGGAFNDTLTGDAGENWLAGAAGDDMLVGGNGSDLLVGGAGNDTLNGDGGTEAGLDDVAVFSAAAGPVSVNLAAGTAIGDGNDTLLNIEHVIGSSHNDTIVGSDGDNVIAGGAGDDDLTGGAGIDQLYYDEVWGPGREPASVPTSGVRVDLAAGVATGGAGNDTFRGFEGVFGSVHDDELIGDGGDNRLAGRGGDDLLQGGGGNDTLEGGDGGDLLEGGAGNDVIDGSGEDSPENSPDDVVVYAHAAGAVIVNLALGTASGADGNDTLRNIDHVIGSAAADSLTGNSGDNVLAGGQGDDALDGGQGVDMAYYGDFEGDLPGATAAVAGVQVDLALGTASGGAGSDTLVQIEGVIGSVFDDVLAGDGAGNVLEGGSGNDQLDGRGGDDRLWGGTGNDSLTGGDGNDKLEGNDGDDLLVGGAGMDWLTGGAGVDTLDGGLDQDVAFFEDAGHGVRVNLRTGVVADDGHGHAESIANVEHLHGGHFDDVLVLAAAGSYAFGRGGADRIEAAEGGSTFYGGSGADTLVGGSGLDMASYWDDGFDSAGRGTRGVVVDLGAGTATDNWGAADVLSGIENVEGSSLNDLLIGDGGNNRLSGMEGEDTLRGGAGDDVLDGGSQTIDLQFDYADYRDAAGAVQVDIAAGRASGAAGNDVLINIEGALGGSGNDTLVGHAARNLFSGGQGDDTIDGGDGFDIVHYRFGTATAGVQVDLQFGQATGGEGNDRLISIEGVIGTDFGDVLVGSSVDNFFRGLQGDDRIDGAGGIDRAGYDRSNGSVQVSLLTGTSSGADGNDTLRNIENLRGGDFADTLEGDNAGNDIEGRGGDDVLRGLGGRDLLKGEAGNDRLEGGDSQDTLRGGAGDDVLDGGAHQTLFEHDYADYTDATGGVTVDLVAGVGTGAGVGRDTLIGIEAVLGSQHGDTLLGSADHNLFNPGAGDDRMVGGDGYDIVGYWDASGPVQIDMRTGRVTGASGNDTLDGFEGALGTAHADVITGDAGNNFIRGYAGDDSLDGGDGFDRAAYDFGSGSVNVSLRTNTATGSEGNDTLANFENLRGGSFNDTLEGNDGVNDLEGGDGNDFIQGLAGDDVLEGQGGEDTLRGGQGNDTLDGGGHGSGQFDYADYRDVVGAVTVRLTGLDGTGNGSATGGDAGTDTLIGIDGVLGGAGDDTIVGGATDDLFSGGLGADSIDGGGGFDIVHYRFGSASDGVQVNLKTGAVTGGDGNDQLTSIEGAIGTDFDDVLIGNDDGNFLRGMKGNDVIDGGAGIDRVAYDRATGAGVVVSLAAGTASGADGDDTLSNIENVRGSDFADTLEGDDQANEIQARNGDDLLRGLGGNDRLFGDAGNDTIEGGAGNDTIVGGAGHDILDGGEVLDRINYTDGNTLDYSSSTAGIVLDTASGQVSDGLGGTDQISNFNFITGTSFSDRLLGSTAPVFEMFDGGAGDDIIDGGAITDTLNQTNANRANFQNAGASVTASLLTGTAVGAQSGRDTLIHINQLRGSNFDDQLEGSDRTDVTETFDGRGGSDRIDGRGGFDEVRYDFGSAGVTVHLGQGTATDASGGVDRLTGIEGVRGSNSADVLTGGLAANGTGVRDGLEWFVGGGGDDRIDGGGGYDRADYTISTAGVVVTLGGTGTGTAQDGMGGTDTLTSIEGVRGSAFDDILTGSDTGEFESFEGRQGNDQIDGRGGEDRADYMRSTAGVVVDLAAGTAQDGYGSADTLQGIENVRGSRDFADQITGDAGANLLEGLGGNDVLSGADGDDRLLGADGDDTLNGGDGDDWLTGGAGTDALHGGAGNDVAFFEDADRAVQIDLRAGTVADDGHGHAELISGVEHLHGGAFGDTIQLGDAGGYAFGRAGADRLAAGAGGNMLIGGSGNDTLVGGAGFDLASYLDDGFDMAGAGTQGVTVNLATGTATDNWGDTDTLSSIDGVIGSALADQLTGNADANHLVGGAGDDAIDGAGGNDTVSYDGASGAVQVSLSAGTADGADGHDTLTSIEHLRGSAFGDVLEGDGSANRIDALDGDDLLDGGAGNDTLLGGEGDDQLTGGAGDDQLEGGAGTDTAVFAGARADYSVGLVAGGMRVVHLAGDEGSDLLFGVEQLQFSDGSTTAPQLGAALVADTGIAGDGITSLGQVQVSGLGSGTAWQYSVNAGAQWADGSGSSFTLPEGSYADGAVQIRLTDAVDLTATLSGAVTVDTTAPTVLTLGTTATLPLDVGQTATLNLLFSSAVTGLTADDLVDSKGGSFGQLASSDGGTSWTVVFTPNGDRLGPASIQLSGAYTDVAGNAGSASSALAIGYAATATASDGYIRGGNIFLDVDRSGTVNSGDIPKGQTGNDGSVAISLNLGEGGYDLLLQGGTDISTGLAFAGLLKAPAGSTMLTPLTTLLADLVQSGAASNVADAQARLGAALGLPSGVDLTSYDPLAVVVTQAGTSTAEEKATALDIQSKTLAVANLLVTGAAALQGAAANGTPVSTEAAGDAVLAALVNQIGTPGAVVDLTSAGTLSTVLGSAAADAAIATSLDAARQAAAVSAASSVLATANQAIASATDAAAAATSTADLLASLSTAVVVQSVVQGTVGSQLAAGQTTGLPTDRDALSTLTQQVDVTQLQLTVDQAVTADTTPPPTPTLALAVDNGSSPSDGISSNGQVVVSGLEAGAAWEYSTDGGTQWAAGSGSAFTLAVGSYTAGQVQARQVDAAGNQSGAGQTATGLTVLAGVNVDLLAYSWKAHTLLSGVQVQGGSHQASTGSDGAARWEAVTDSSLGITASRAVPQGEAADTAQAVNLQDAIAVLRMVVGLDVNGPGRPLSPYQSFAADFNADGQVGLSDAIGVLRHVVGLDAPRPQWLLFDEADTTVAARAGLQPGQAPDIGLLLQGNDARIGLVGVLRGDVDGSFAGAAGAADLDQLQPTYFADLATDKQIDPAQFGIYS